MITAKSSRFHVILVLDDSKTRRPPTCSCPSTRGSIKALSSCAIRPSSDFLSRFNSLFRRLPCQLPVAGTSEGNYGKQGGLRVAPLSFNAIDKLAHEHLPLFLSLSFNAPSLGCFLSHLLCAFVFALPCAGSRPISRAVHWMKRRRAIA